MVYRFNDSLDKALVRPIARGYRQVAPRIVQTGVSNFFANAKYPTVIVNNALQGKVVAAGSDTARFLINTTIGLAGLLDPATTIGLDANDEDFGQTLGRWGIRPGPYLVLPVLGPYTVRDGIGSLADDFTEPRHYLDDPVARYGLWAVDRLETRARLLDAEAVLDRAGDPYAFVRSAYLQRREYLVRDGEIAAEDSAIEDPELEDPEPETTDAAAAASPPTDGVSPPASPAQSEAPPPPTP